MLNSSSLLIEEIQRNGIPDFWMDTRKMQDAYSLETKGKAVYIKSLFQRYTVDIECLHSFLIF